VQHEHRPEQLRARPQALDQERQRDVLVVQRVGHGLARPVDQIAEGRVSRKVRPHHERVREIAERPAEPPGPPGCRRADREVLLSRIAVQQRVKRREQRHVERGTPRAGEGLQGRQNLSPDLTRHGSTLTRPI
jgi:hypothetical protein